VVKIPAKSWEILRNLFGIWAESVGAVGNFSDSGEIYRNLDKSKKDFCMPENLRFPRAG
jgi:hypothetical protein